LQCCGFKRLYSLLIKEKTLFPDIVLLLFTTVALKLIKEPTRHQAVIDGGPAFLSLFLQEQKSKGSNQNDAHCEDRLVNEIICTTNNS
jgi:hypothetical protein